MSSFSRRCSISLTFIMFLYSITSVLCWLMSTAEQSVYHRCMQNIPFYPLYSVHFNHSTRRGKRKRKRVREKAKPFGLEKGGH